MNRSLLSVLACVVLACTPEIPEGHAVCADASQCPATWVCRADHRCWRAAETTDGGPIDDGGTHDGSIEDGGSVDGGRADTGLDAAGDANTDASGDVGTDAACAGHAEICNGLDDDCDGLTDDLDPDLGCDWHYCNGNTCDAPDEVAAGLQHTCVLTDAGHIWCWGASDHAQLGVPSAGAGSALPVHVTAGAMDLAAGANHTCIVDVDGVHCWGFAYFGQIGNGMMMGSDQPTPYLVANTGGATSVTAGDFHTCATLPDARNGLSCWGRNNAGQLGDGTTTPRALPGAVLPGGISRPAFAGGLHTCYLLSPGTVRCWGQNDRGQLGIGTIVDARSPVPTSPTITDGHEVRPGAEHTCVYRNDGASVHGYYCWGANDQGQLGDGSMMDRHAPVPVSAVALDAGTVTAHYLAAGTSHTCATDANRRLWCWGANDQGQLGTGVMGLSRATPQVTMLSGMVAAIDAGASHTCAIVGSELYCWGANSQGQLGDGTMTPSPVPTRIVVRTP